MTIVFGVLVYLAIMTGILLFFRFIRTADHDMRELSLEPAEIRPAQAVAHFHRQSA